MGAKLSGSRNRRSRVGSQQQFSEINVTPMVDVMLVLLVIFMVAAPMMTTGVTVDLPKTSASPVKGQDEPLTVSVTHKGEIYIQKAKVPLKEFRAKLRAITKEKKDTRIFVRGDHRVDYGDVMRVVSEINEAGYSKVALITDPSSIAGKRK